MVPSTSVAAELNATPGTLPGVFGSAQGGDTILLGAGEYGTFAGGLKPGVVTLRPQPGAAVTMRLDFSPASNIAIEGVTLGEVELANSGTKNITVRNSDIPGQTTFRTGELQNANILFDNNVHRDWDKCDGCGEGRVWLPEKTAQPSGITIQNSEFRGGLSDGIQNGSNGTRIIGNEFHRIESGSADGVHADAIQLYGSRNTLIRGNWFYDLPQGVGNIMSPDGADHEVIEDNVFSPLASGGETRPFAIDLLSDDGSVVRHNTFADGSCEFNLRCGIVRLGAKSADDAGRGTLIQDNVMGEISCCDGSATYTASHNLVRSRTYGANDIKGLPSFVGGQRPGSFAGFALASSSLGRGNASDGLDRGARFGAAGPPAAPGVTPPAGTRRLRRGPRVVRFRVRSRLRSVVRTGKVRLTVWTTRPGTVKLSGGIRMGRRGKGSRRVLELRPVKLRNRRVGKRKITMKVSREARGALRRKRVLRRKRMGRLSLRVVAPDPSGDRSARIVRLKIRR